MDEIINSMYIKNDEILEIKHFNKENIKSGKSIYEVIRIIDSVPLFLEDHLKRLNNSFDITNNKIWLSYNEIKVKLLKLIKINKVSFGNVKLVFNIEDNGEKCFLAYFIKHKYPTYENYINGINVILYHGERNNPNVKIVNENFREKVNKQIKKCNAYEAILVDRNGNITEGSRSNIFMVKGDNIITPPLEDVLPGVTRGIIINICKQNGLNIEEKKIHYKKLNNMDAVFISGTSPKVLPVCFIGEKKFFSSSNNNVLKIIKNYDNIVREYINKNKICI